MAAAGDDEVMAGFCGQGVITASAFEGVSAGMAAEIFTAG